MSDVTRDGNGFHDGVGGRSTDVLGRLEGGEGRSGYGRRKVPDLAGGVERLASGSAPRRDRVAELEDAAGYRGSDLRREAKLFAWWGTRASLTSELVSDRIALINHLTSICRAERQRGLAGHWTYDKSRHDQIAHILACEESELQEIMEARNAV